jgi:hypothetical protein
MTKLERCPFCGAEAEVVRNSSGSYFARCTNRQCAAKTRLYHENEAGARLAWNRRAESTCHYVYDREICAWRCSECGGIEPVGDHVSYCPDCGAKVVGE